MNIQQIRDNIENAQHLLDQAVKGLEALMSDEITITEIEAWTDGDRLFITFDSNSTKRFDVLYSRTDEDRVHSLAHNYRDGRPLPTLDEGAINIGFNGSPNWEIKIVVHEDYEIQDNRWVPVGSVLFESDWVTAKQEDENGDEDDDTKYPDEIEPRVFFHGFWDHYTSRIVIPDNLKDYVNIGKSMSRSVRDIHVPKIMHLGNLANETKSQREARVRSVEAYATSDTEIIHFIDEPLAKCVPGNELDELVHYARNLYGDRFRYAYTINAAELYFPQNRCEDSYAQNFDYVFHQSYPYRVDNSEMSFLMTIGDTRQELFDSLDLRLQTLQEKIPNSKFWIIGQGFRGEKWREMPVEAVQWYFEWCASNQCEGLLWWKYATSSGTEGLDRMPEHVEEIKRSFEWMNQ